jgi:translation initiation factor 2B subunit (eIF-2B alpha/beta/delta family)
MDPTIARQIDELGRDAVSSASALTGLAISILDRAAALDPAALCDVVVRLCRAQPAMASIWNAGAAALAGSGALERFDARIRRAPAAIARALVDLVLLDAPADRPVRVVTWSASLTVIHGLEAMAARRPVEVSCSEGRPRLEGRRLAERLAAAGIPVRFYTDAGLCSALDEAAVALCGADAVGPDWVVNKAGTRAMAAAAREIGVPLYVCAGREKLLSPDLARLLRLSGGPATEVWDDAPRGVTVVNPYFERAALGLATVITDAGALVGPMVADACEAAAHEAGVQAVAAALMDAF